MNTTQVTFITNSQPNYCVLPTEHNHLIEDESSLIVSKINQLFGNGSIVFSLGNGYRIINYAPLAANLSSRASDLLFLEDSLGKTTTKSVSISSSPTSQNQLDPYIDAVEVKSRLNNQRGPRVKAHKERSTKLSLSSKLKPATRIATNNKQDHEPNSSYYITKTVQVEEHGKDGHSWKVSKNSYDYSDDEHSDDEDDDDDDHDYQHHHDHYGKKKVKKKPKKKKIYVKKKKYPAKKKHKKYHHKSGGGHHDNDYHNDDHHHYYKGKGKKYKVKLKKKKMMNKHPKKQIKYAYIYKPEHYKHYDHGHQHYEKHNSDDYHHKKHHDSYHSKPKKHGFSLAGLLGYTLLCVNYLMVMQQPTYDKYSGYYHSEYSPHEKMHIKPGGPIILAHCSDLPEPRGLMKLNSSLVSSSNRSSALELNNKTLMESTIKPNASLNLDHATAADQSGYYFARKSQPSARSELLGPPTYYYTSSGSSLLSPIQNYLNRLFLPTSDINDADLDDYRQVNPNFLVQNRRNMNRQRLVVNNDNRQVILNNGLDNQLNGPSARLRSLTRGGQARGVILIEGQQAPQIVQTKDNLASTRSRTIPIGMRITRRRFVGPERPVNLVVDYEDGLNLNNNPIEDEDARSALNGNLQNFRLQVPVAVRPPIESVDNNNNNNNNNETDLANRMLQDEPQQNNVAPGNNQIVDLPDYALSGDSIELSCNHRWPVSQLYSVKWFKDSLEFYRFIPANGARAKDFLHLPDVRLDLTRSDSQVLYLRNVTHRTGGLYRCEVVSEGPNFETVSGEKRMQVYALPETGPRLSLLEGVNLRLPIRPPAQPPLAAITSGAVITSNGPVITTTTTTANRRQQANSVAISDNEQVNWLGSGFNGPQLTSDVEQNGNLQRPQLLPVSGPIVRCESARSNPVAQLRFFINNQLVDLARTLENQTHKFDDEMESNMISLKLTLDDFRMATLPSGNSEIENENNNNVAGALLKAKSKGSSLVAGNQSQALEFITSSTTTTTTTMRPRNFASTNKRVDDKDKLKLEGASNGSSNANAAVQFDDQPDDKLVKLIGAKAKASSGNLKPQADQKLKKHKKRPNGKATKPKAPQTTSGGELPIVNNNNYATANEEEDDNDADYTNETKSLVDSAANFTSTQLPVNLSDRRARDNKSGDNIAAKEADYETKSDLTASEKANSRTSISSVRQRRSGLTGEQLVKLEQQRVRSTIASRINAVANGSGESGAQQQQQQQQQQQRQVYSNYIRIKCTSLVPAVGYEMTGELNVPLTVLVPASRLSDALTAGGLAPASGQRQSGASGSASSVADLRNQINTLLGPRADQQEANNKLQQAGGLFGSRSFRNGGSLQSPRAVLIDRLAQASSPPSRGVVAAPNEQSSMANSNNNNSNGTTQTNSTATTTTTTGGRKRPQKAQRQKTAQERALEQRARHLEELARMSKQASSGATSSFGFLWEFLMAVAQHRQYSAGDSDLWYVYKLAGPLIVSVTWIAIFGKWLNAHEPRRENTF